VLVDEYQDTNALQAEIVRRLKPEGRGVTVVGDDAQAIYSFRAASVDNILGFPGQFQPAAQVLPLEQNYRSTMPILSAANAVIALSSERHDKSLWTSRAGGARPRLTTVADEIAQVDWVVGRILERRESGVPLRQQAVLFRAAHHSEALEIELSRRNIPFVKYGGLRFLEAAHVKDVIACLRWAENPRDELAGFRVAQLLPGLGPRLAERLCSAVAAAGWALADACAAFVPPAPARDDWPAFAELYRRLCALEAPWPGQLGQVRRWYQPHLERLHDDARIRLQDLQELETLADLAPSRERFLSELILDPPEATGAEAGPPHLDEDYLVLSTIHSAKGLEWDVVHVIHAADGMIPSDMSTGDDDEIEEERRLLYVALTRARDALHVTYPQRYYRRPRGLEDPHSFSQRSRFLPDEVLQHFEVVGPQVVAVPDVGTPVTAAADVDAFLAGLWAD
jgi:DNA helicase-2/ATP-dependent DNA helicase PcrA